MRGWSTVASLALVVGAAAAGASERTLEEIVVEERAPGDFDDVEQWNREVRDALARATLKPRAELTADDHAQILILEREMPGLERALDDLERLTRAHRFRRTLTQRETLQLAAAYRTAESILENVPDAFMPRCRLRPKYGRRNQAAVCGIDYLAIERQVDEFSRQRARAGAEHAREGEAIAVSVPKDPVFITAARAAKRREPARVHVQSDYFRLGQVRVALSGTAMLTREDFHARATERPALKPAHPLRLELPTGTGMSLGPADTFKVVGHASMGGEIVRVAQLPRAGGVGYGIVVRNDGTIEGTLVAYAYGWSDRRRLVPLDGLRAAVLPADARLLPLYDVDEVLDDSVFIRHDLAFLGADAAKIVFELRRYDAPAPAPVVQRKRFEFAAVPATIAIAGLTIQLREIEPGRLKYVVEAARPAAGSLAGTPPSAR